MTILDIYYTNPFENKQHEFNHCRVSNLFSKKGVLAGTLYSDINENSHSPAKISLINSFQAFFFDDGIVFSNIMNSSKKCESTDLNLSDIDSSEKCELKTPNIFNIIISKQVYTSGKYSKYIDTLQIKIDVILLKENKKVLLKYTFFV